MGQPSPQLLKSLLEISQQVRRDVLTMIYQAGSGHSGGCLSQVELLVALYFHKMRVDPKNPNSPDRDRFVLSKGHACSTLYSCLARKGFFPLEEMSKFRKINALLQGHADIRVPGVEMSGGSLGQGLSFGNGLAFAAKLDKKSYTTYVLMGDGEQEEGQIWEAAMTAAHYKLDNVVGIIDRNKIQNDGFVADTKNIEPLAGKWESFGWAVKEIDGHNFHEIINALDWADARAGKPKLIIAHTVKGKGVSFMENNPEYHGKAPNEEELKLALKEIG